MRPGASYCIYNTYILVDAFCGKLDRVLIGFGVWAYTLVSEKGSSVYTATGFPRSIISSRIVTLGLAPTLNYLPSGLERSDTGTMSEPKHRRRTSRANDGILSLRDRMAGLVFISFVNCLFISSVFSLCFFLIEKNNPDQHIRGQFGSHPGPFLILFFGASLLFL